MTDRNSARHRAVGHDTDASQVLSCGHRDDEWIALETTCREQAEEIARLTKVIATHQCSHRATWCGEHKVFHDGPYPSVPAICAALVRAPRPPA